MAVKVDLHTHSEASPAGGISLEEYRAILDRELLDVVAITDHNTIEFAQQAEQELGNLVIVGEEISSIEGDVIGLFLSNKIDPGLSLADTIDEIRSQDGLVYVPHPFEKVRKGISEEDLEVCIDKIDLIETINGRAWIDNRSTKAKKWAAKHNQLGVASSDAHHVRDVGKTFTVIEEHPTVENLLELVENGELHFAPPSLTGITAPSINRWQKRHQK